MNYCDIDFNYMYIALHPGVLYVSHCTIYKQADCVPPIVHPVFRMIFSPSHSLPIKDLTLVSNFLIVPEDIIFFSF